MAERDRFELELADFLRAYAEDAPTEVRPAELAHRFATAYHHRRIALGRWGLAVTPAMAWVLLLTGLLLATAVIGGLIAGGLLPPRPPQPAIDMTVTPAPSVVASPAPSSVPTTWTQVAWQPSMMGGLGPVVWTGSRFVAVARGSGQLAFVSSADGETWERQSPILPAALESPGDVSVNTLATGPGGVVAGGSVAADGMVWYSPDGATWTSVTGPPFKPSQGASLGVDAVTPAGNGWVAIGEELGPPCEPEGCLPKIFRAVAWSSRDGLHWTRASTSPIFDKAIVNSVAVAGQGFVAVGIAAAEATASTDSGGIVLADTKTSSWHPAVWTSADGLAWSRVPEPASFYGTTAVVDGPAGLVAIGNDNEVRGGSAAWWSADGRTWVPSAADFSPASLGAAAASSDEYLILGGPVGPGGWPDPKATPLPNACPSFIWSSADGRDFRCVQVAWSGGSFTGQGAAASASIEIIVGSDSAGGAAWLRRLP